MTDKRYQLRQEDLDYPIYSDLVDTEDNDKVICTFNNDSGTNKMVVLLNEQDKTIKELEKENENQNNILEDFMVMLNRLQAEPNNKSLQSMAKDMLRMMGKDIMGDSE